VCALHVWNQPSADLFASTHDADFALRVDGILSEGEQPLLPVFLPLECEGIVEGAVDLVAIECLFLNRHGYLLVAR